MKKSNLKQVKKDQQPKFIFFRSYLYMLLFLTTILIMLNIIALYVQTKHLFVFHNIGNKKLLINPTQLYFSLAILVINFGCYRYLLAWKKWPVWALLIAYLLSIPISLDLGGDFRHILMGFFGYGVLIALMFMGGKKRAWNYLK